MRNSNVNCDAILLNRLCKKGVRLLLFSEVLKATRVFVKAHLDKRANQAVALFSFKLKKNEKLCSKQLSR